MGKRVNQRSIVCSDVARVKYVGGRTGLLKEKNEGCFGRRNKEGGFGRWR